MPEQNQQIIPPEVGYRLAGFADGEGCFSIRRQKQRNGRVAYGCEFALNVRWDDREALEWYRNETGLGSIYFMGRPQPAFPNAQPLARWAIHRRDECARLVDIFEAYPLRTKKARDFAVWAQAVRYWNGDKPEGMAPLARWYQEIRDGRAYDPEAVAIPEADPPMPALFDWSEE